MLGPGGRPPAAAPGEVVVDVARLGVCGTDVEFFTGEMTYLHDGHAAYPMRLGHEWCGVVSAVGPGVDAAWRGRRVVGDTMLGCGRCRRCRSGRQHTCDDRTEVGIRGGRAGALAEQLAVPVSSLALELVEPGKRVVDIGISATRTIDTRCMLLKDVTAVGVLSGSPALAPAVEAYAGGSVGPRPLVAATVGLTAWATSWRDAVPPVPGPAPRSTSTPSSSRTRTSHDRFHRPRGHRDRRRERHRRRHR